MIQIKRSNEIGSIDNWMIATIGLIVLSVGLAIFGIWSFTNYNDQKTDVDSKISDAVAVAKKAQADADEAKFAQREKEPGREFVGPDDYGQVTFNYPKTWSVYVDKDASSGGAYEAYMNPVSVPVIGGTQQIYALRVAIDQQDYDAVLADFNPLVQEGALKSSSVSASGTAGTRLDGAFSADIHGSMVIFKIRDKVLTIRTDAETFKADFNALITTIKFKQ